MENAPPENMVAADIGNTSIHAATFAGSAKVRWPEPLRRLDLSITAADLSELHAWLPGESADWFVASVNHEATARLVAWIKRNRPDVRIRVLRHDDLPLRLAIEHPETAGLDRLVAAVAANRLREPNRPAVVIDAGTAITVDALAPDGTFLGGAILPGVSTSAAALNARTSQLPAVGFGAEMGQEEIPPAIGSATNAAIRSGVYWGAVGAVGQLVRQMTAELSGDPHVFLTGGEATLLACSLPQTIQPLPQMVLSGIAIVAQHLTGPS